MSSGEVDTDAKAASLMGMREALARKSLLGFDTSRWGSPGGMVQSGGKAAFVGGPNGRPPANDEITRAIVIGGTTSFESTRNATVSAGESTTIVRSPGVDNTQSQVGATVWYSYTPSISGQVKFTTDGSDFDTTLQAYIVTDPTQSVSYSNITKLAGASNDDDQYNPPRGSPGRSDNSTITFNAVAGTTYYIQSGGYVTSNGPSTGNLQFSETGPVGAPCYCTGTLIRVARGRAEVDVAVEALQVGDVAVTASGTHRSVRWLGHRVTDCRRHPRQQEVMPVRVSAHAFGENRPARDLLVSPGHSLCVDVLGEVLIPAMALINGTTIVQEYVDSVTYWHVELDSHDILLAENMPAESYLEMGNRAFFAESDVVVLGALPDAPVVTHADFCRPFHSEGALVEAVRAQLAARAKKLGWTLEMQGLGDLHLVVDGVRIEPTVLGLSARFTVPAAARDVWLVSNAGAPSLVSATSDARLLGACLRGISIDDGSGVELDIALDDLRLSVGFHALEGDGEIAWRWTGGRALLPATLWGERYDDFFLRLDLAEQALPRWVAPQHQNGAKGIEAA